MTPEQIDQLKADLAFVLNLFPVGLYNGSFDYEMGNGVKVKRTPIWINDREVKELKRILDASND